MYCTGTRENQLSRRGQEREGASGRQTDRKEIHTKGITCTYLVEYLPIGHVRRSISINFALRGLQWREAQGTHIVFLR